MGVWAFFGGGVPNRADLANVVEKVAIGVSLPDRIELANNVEQKFGMRDGQQLTLSFDAAAGQRVLLYLTQIRTEDGQKFPSLSVTLRAPDRTELEKTSGMIHEIDHVVDAAGGGTFEVDLAAKTLQGGAVGKSTQVAARVVVIGPDAGPSLKDGRDRTLANGEMPIGDVFHHRPVTYRFELPAGRQTRFGLWVTKEQPGRALKPTLSIYGPDGAPVRRDNGRPLVAVEGLRGLAMTFETLEAGVYTALVDTGANLVDPMSFQARIVCVPHDGDASLPVAIDGRDEMFETAGQPFDARVTAASFSWHSIEMDSNQILEIERLPGQPQGEGKIPPPVQIVLHGPDGAEVRKLDSSSSKQIRYLSKLAGRYVVVLEPIEPTLACGSVLKWRVQDNGR